MEENNKYRQTLKRIENEHPFYNNTDLAYECILDRILSGDLKPGDKLLQENLSKNLDMSRTPIRDALIRLERENYLEKNGTGFQVCSFQAGAKELRRLGILMMIIPIGFAVLAEIIQGIMTGFMNVGADGWSELNFDNEASVIVGVMFVVGSFICGYGAELLEDKSMGSGKS